MSTRKKPNQAVDLLLDRLDKAKKQVLQQDAYDEQSLSSKFDVFRTELESMRYVLPNINSWEKSIMDHFWALEQELDNDIFNDPDKISEVNDRLDRMTAAIRKPSQSIPSVVMEVSRMSPGDSKPGHVPADDHIDDHRTVCQEWVDLKVDNKLLETGVMSSFMTSFHCLSGSKQAKMCSLCLSVFPVNSIIEKRPLIYWWMGEGLVMKSRDKTAEEVGEQVFRELLDEGFIKPSSMDKYVSVNSFIVDPWIHRMLILISKKNSFVEFSPQWTPCNGKRRAFLCQENDVSQHTRISGEKEAEEGLMMVFNVNEQYVDMKPEYLSNLKKVEVLQLGRWQACVSDHHIEVVDQALLDRLGSQKRLKYLSLRGIFRIETLPASISKLISLQILDLRACHNLEKLPPEISKLKNLTHLDVSQCYLLESMPKGLEHLVALQVLKGFVIGKAEKTSCKISDLAQLKKLRKLSIRVGNKGETQQDYQLRSLVSLSALHILTISWGNVSSAQGKVVSLPKTLTKLDLRFVPFESVPDWLSPSNLPSDLTKLYIEGGRLKSLKTRDNHVWNVKYLRFKHLRHLIINDGELANYMCSDKLCCYEQIHPPK